MLNGLPEVPVTAVKARELSERSYTLMRLAIDGGAHVLAGDAAKGHVHWSRYANALETKLDPALAKLARAAAAMTLPAACDWEAKAARESDPLDQGLARLTRAEVETAIAPLASIDDVAAAEVVGFELVR